MMMSHWPCYRGRKEGLGHTRFEMVTVCPVEKPLEIKHAGKGKAGKWLRGMENTGTTGMN